jgi:eukaryotic-like serine/threonine-protein kinase
VAEDVFGIVGSVQADVFRVDAVVAEGGFAVVYRAHHQGFRAEVALKCLKIPGTLSREQRDVFLQKFHEEGELLFRLSALLPPVVRPLHVGVAESSRAAFVPFMALEWLDGESLDALIARRRAAGKRPLDLPRAVKLLGPVARAIECAHAFPTPQGTVSVLHRDLKPDNVVIAHVHGQEVAKILDFGIGKVKSHATQVVGRASATEDALGAFTPGYGAPEQWLPKRFGQTGPWTDIWGFALTLVELVTAQTPLEGDAHAVLGACLDETRRPTPRTLGLDLPDAVEAAFARALAVDPQRRFQQMGEFWDAVEGPLGIVTPRFSRGTSTLESLPPPPGGGAAIPDLVPAAAPVRRPERRDRLEPPPALSLLRDDAGVQGSRRSPVNSREARDHREGSALPGVREFDGAPELQGALELQGELQRDLSPVVARPVAYSRRPPAAVTIREAPATRDLIERARGPLGLIGMGIGVSLLDQAYGALTGSTFSLGPVRAVWIAGPLVLLGMVKLALAIFWRQ